MKLDNHQLGLKRLKVAMSNCNPPKKAVAATNYPVEGEVPANKGGGDSDGFKKPSFIPSQARRCYTCQQ